MLQSFSILAVTCRVLAGFLSEIKRAVELVPASMVIDTVMLAQAEKAHAGLKD